MRRLRNAPIVELNGDDTPEGGSLGKLAFIIVAAMALLPSVASSTNGWHQPLASMDLIAGFTAGGHIGEDYDANENDPVYAIADGTVWFYDANATCYGGGNGTTCACEPGVVLFIRHRKADGTYFIAQYGHIKNVPTALRYAGRNASGPAVSAGQHIADIAVFAPCRDCSSRCDHLHLGWWDSQNDIPNSGWGYGPACYSSPSGCWVAASWAFANYAPYGGTPSYQCSWVANSPEQTASPGGGVSLTVKYRNTGRRRGQTTRT